MIATHISVSQIDENRLFWAAFIPVAAILISTGTGEATVGYVQVGIVQPAKMPPADSSILTEVSLAHSEIDDGKKSKGFERFARLLSNSSEYASFIYRERAKDYLQTGQYQASLNDCLEVQKLEPGRTQDLNSLGLAYSFLGDKVRAKRSFALAIESKPDFALPYYNRALDLMDEGNYSDAIRDLKMAMKLRTEYTWRVRLLIFRCEVLSGLNAFF